MTAEHVQDQPADRELTYYQQVPSEIGWPTVERRYLAYAALRGSAIDPRLYSALRDQAIEKDDNQLHMVFVDTRGRCIGAEIIDRRSASVFSDDHTVDAHLANL